jgi:hypothetical protein
VPSAYSLLDDLVSWNQGRRKDGVPLWASLGGLRRRGRARPEEPTPTV